MRPRRSETPAAKRHHEAYARKVEAREAFLRGEAVPFPALPLDWMCKQAGPTRAVLVATGGAKMVDGGAL